MADYKKSHSEAPATFTLTVDQIKTVFDILVPTFEGAVKGFLAEFDVADPGPSLEKLALMSLSWNNPGKMLGDALGNALSAPDGGNRAEAWYEIRYDSNGGQSSGGTAKRRYIESYLFGLYDGAIPTEKEALQTYAMLTKHRETIIKYEKKWGVPADSIETSKQYLTVAQFDYSALREKMGDFSSALPLGSIPTLRQTLQPASDILVSKYGQGRIFSPLNIFVSEAGSVPINRSQDNSADLIIGYAADETLIGGSGDDVIFGGGGNNTLKGGAGDDKYVHSFNDQVDAIADSDGQGSVWVQNNNGGTQQFTGGGSAANPYTWIGKSSGEQYKFEPLSGGNSVGKLTVTGGALGTGKIIINNFDLNHAKTYANGYLGIKFEEKLAVAPSVNRDDDPFIDGTYTLSDAVIAAKGVLQTLTVYASASRINAQQVTITLAGDSSSFKINTGADLLDFINGTVALTIPAGADSVTVGLVYTGNDSSATAQLIAALTDPNTAVGDAVTVSNTFTVNFSGSRDTASSAQSQPDNIINGDLNPINFGTDDNPQYQRDALGNLITDSTSSAPGRDDTLYGSSGNDLINAGGGNNQVWGIEGADTIIAGDGGNLIHDGDGNNSVTVGNGANQIFLGNGANTLTMGTGSDYVTVGDGNNQIEGNGGRDVIVAGNGDNAIFANKKTDLASAIANRDSLSVSGLQGDLIAVGRGNNTIVSGTGNDLVVLGGGNDVIVLGPGNDTVAGGEVASQVYLAWSAQSVMNGGQPSAGSFVDTVTHYQGLTTASSGGYVPSAGLSALLAQYPSTQQYNVDPYGNPVGGGSETIFGGSGNDLIVTSNGNNYVDAGSGNSLVYAGAGDDTIFGGTGNSTITGGGGDDYVDGESGNHLIAGGAGNNTIFGGSGNDTIYAGVPYGSSTGDINAGNNYVDVGSGNSIVFGSAGNDTLVAGSGQDTLVAGNGNTTIYGGTGVDLIYGGSGNDLIYAGDGGTAGAATTVVAGSGNTTIYGGQGVDVIYGGAGSDVIYVGDGGSAAQRSVVYAGSGNTTVYGGLGADEIHGGSGNDVLYAGDGGSTDAPTVVYAGTGNSTLYGGAGVDILNASAAGSTLLVGGSGNETLVGGAGDDTLVAGSGNDSMDGGAGSNTYVFNSGAGSSEIVQSGGTDILQFGSGISASDLSISATLGANGAPALEISVGGSSVIVDGAFSGQVGAVTFADGGTMSLAQLMAQAEIVPSTVTSTTDTSVDFDASGHIRVTKYAADGTALSDVWQSVDGSAGGDTFSADGSSRGVAVLANGNTQYQFNDGKGDTTTYTYDASHKLVGDSWTNAAGNSGADMFNADGSSNGTAMNADGTTSTYANDGQGDKVTQYYSSSGVLTGDAWVRADGTSGSDTFDANGKVTVATTIATDGSQTVKTNDGLGDTSTALYDSAGNKTSGTWQSADGSYGSGQLSNGVWTSLDYAVDGSHTESTTDAAGNTTSEQFSSAGIPIAQSWSHVDGTHGSTAFATDGSSDSYTYNRGGSYSETKTDASGNTVTSYYSASGQQLYDTWHHVDGTSGSDFPNGTGPDVAANFKAHGVYASVVKDETGNKTINILGSDGTQIYSIYEDQIYTGTGTGGGGYGGDGYGGGYGSAYASPVPVAILQVTPGANGVREVQEVGLSGPSGASGVLKNTEILADGSLFENTWDAGLSMGDLVSTSYGSLPGSVFHTSNGSLANSATTGPTLQSGGTVIEMPGGILLYDDGTQLVEISGVSYSGAPVTVSGDQSYAGVFSSIVAGAFSSSGSTGASSTTGTSSYASSGTYMVTYTYSGGGQRQVGYVNNIYVSDTMVDGQGGSWSMTLTPPSGSTVFDRGTVYAVTSTTDAGYTHTHTEVQNSPSLVTDVYKNADGSVAESDTNADGMTQTDVLHDQNGNTISSTFNVSDPNNPSASTLQTTAVDQAGDVITTHYQWTDANAGEIVTSSWTTQDGTQVSMLLDSTTDAYQATSRYTDGTYSIVTSDAQGGYFDRDYDALGNLVSDQWLADNGDTGTDIRHANGSVDSVATYHLANGIVESTTTVTQADGSYQRTWTKTDGSSGTDIRNADGTGSGTAQFADGTYNTYTRTAQGVVTTLNYDASGNQVSYAVSSVDSTGQWLQTTYDLNGVRLRDQWIRADGTTGSDVFNTDGTVETKTSWTNAQGIAIQADKVTQPDGSFVQTWSGSDGSTGTDIGNADGSVTGTSDSPTGGHGTYTNDGHGNALYDFTATADGQTVIGASTGVNHLEADAAYNYVRLQGGNGNDTFVLNAVAGSWDVARLGDGNNTVYGGDGNDLVDLGAGNNTVVLGNGRNLIDSTSSPNAGNGNNAVYLGDGANSMWLGDGNNTIGVGTGSNSINVGNGNNTLYAGRGAAANSIVFGNGANVVTVGDGANTVNGGNGNDTIWGGGGGNQITVGDGNDVIGLGSGNNTVKTGNGASSVSVGDGVNRIRLGDGANTVNAGAGANTIVGGNGDNAAYVGNGSNEVEFGDGNNTVGLGTGSNSVVLGGGSNIVYAGRGTGSNSIFVGNGTNVVTVADGMNYVGGGNGADKVYGGNGSNTIQLGDGADTVNVGDGANNIRIGDGGSVVYVGNGNNQIALGQGDDTVSAGNGNNTLSSGRGNNGIWMGSGSNRIQVGDGNNTIGVRDVAGSVNSIQVGDGNNTIRVGDGTDAVQTGKGANVLQLGSGQVTLTNYGGQDTVTFASSVQDDQLWFAQDGNDLLVTVDGTSSNLRLTDWFNGATHATLVAGDGHQLIDSQVASLVQAMSQFSPPAVGQTTLPQAQQDSLMPVIAASWR
ncbi:beta strand repeat-containing protein [Ralstonia solanacearum]|uniref:beta strand repeat-containing protein n=1 Tax=Ralstonia solanacearum TaxID=305 RepID=UPI001E473053|nr:calcium-binding protein [Ralstonia solanacearum]